MVQGGPCKTVLFQIIIAKKQKGMARWLKWQIT
jgi:hypothetical protein